MNEVSRENPRAQAAEGLDPGADGGGNGNLVPGSFVPVVLPMVMTGVELGDFKKELCMATTQLALKVSKCKDLKKH